MWHVEWIGKERLEGGNPVRNLLQYYLLKTIKHLLRSASIGTGEEWADVSHISRKELTLLLALSGREREREKESK